MCYCWSGKDYIVCILHAFNPKGGRVQQRVKIYQQSIVNNINLKRKHYILGGIFIILLATNPSRSSYNSFLHRGGDAKTGRDFNGLIFSVYSSKYWGTKSYHIGILGNFIRVYTIKNYR